jgi:hypothetical protein
MVVVQVGQKDLRHVIRMDAGQVNVLQRSPACIEQEFLAIRFDERRNAGPFGRQLRSAGPDEVHSQLIRLRASKPGAEHEHEGEKQRFSHCRPPDPG